MIVVGIIIIIFFVTVSEDNQTSQTTVGFATLSVTLGHIVVSNENLNL